MTPALLIWVVSSHATMSLVFLSAAVAMSLLGVVGHDHPCSEAGGPRPEEQPQPLGSTAAAQDGSAALGQRLLKDSVQRVPNV